MRFAHLRVYGLGAGLSLLTCMGASGQNIGPSLGTVELRWRERSTSGYNGSYTIGPWVSPGVDAVPTPDPSAASVAAQDANVVLVLEARVTQAVGITGAPIRGLRGTEFSITTNQASGGSFGRQIVEDHVPSANPRGNARVSARNLGFDPSTLLEHPATSVTRGLVSPFRHAANNSGGLDGPGVGHFRVGTNTIHKILAGLQPGNLEPSNIDATHPGAYEHAGLDAWVPIYIAVYNITDVKTERDIVFTVANVDSESAGPGTTDYGFRTWRGQSNPSNGDIDLWQLSPGFVTPPTFTVHVVPGPGAAGVLGVAGLTLAARRRRVSE